MRQRLKRYKEWLEVAPVSEEGQEFNNYLLALGWLAMQLLCLSHYTSLASVALDAILDASKMEKRNRIKGKQHKVGAGVVQANISTESPTINM